jgi:hypothetical protein
MPHELPSAQIHGAIQPRYGEVHIRNRGAFPLGKNKKAFTSSPFILLIRSPAPSLRKSPNATASSHPPKR